MHWIALEPATAQERLPWCWRALSLSPRVTQLDEAVLLEVSTCLRLWGSLAALRQRLFAEPMPGQWIRRAEGATSLIALGQLRSTPQAGPLSLEQARQLPLHSLSAARPHLSTLERLGCRCWGDLCALPRAALARRFGQALLDALDQALGQSSDTYPWLSLPEHFEQQIELPAPAHTSAQLLASAAPALALLQQWLQARQLGVSALKLRWVLERQRFEPAASQTLVLRTAQAVQHMGHLQRLLQEQLRDKTWSAPAQQLHLRALRTQPWQPQDASVLTSAKPDGEAWQQLLERLSARLGPSRVLSPVLQADHRPEQMQRWLAAQDTANQATAHTTSYTDPQSSKISPKISTKTGTKSSTKTNAVKTTLPEALLYPPWLLREPQPLALRAHQPWHRGALKRLSPALRIEASWWSQHNSDQAPQGSQRDYFIAHSPGAGLLWVYRLRQAGLQAQQQWFLHGFFA